MSHHPTDLPHIGPRRVEHLRAAGLDTVADLAAADPAVPIPGIPQAIVRRAIAAARTLVAVETEAPPEPMPDPEAPPQAQPVAATPVDPARTTKKQKKRARRGARTARALAALADAVRQERKRAPSKKAAKVRRELARTRTALGQTADRASLGLSKGDRDRVAAAVKPLRDEIDRVSGRKLDARRTRRLRKAARRTRRALRALD